MALCPGGYQEAVQTGYLGAGGSSGKGAITGKLTKYPVNMLVSIINKMYIL